ncbi:bicaudal C homolog 2 [Engraulis encrasicolus]|uniref:bicaudal C homolog 2 n=1 Tax=Engraulis encrasicolus TaxID=184585 RepID=UPI002FD0D927
MLYTPKDGNGLTGEEFFEKVMKETNTQVKWPSKLKIGAKSRKDPHVKVEGKKENVQLAKKKILELLETKVNKVTLKMDVTHTEHSHVIGKGGGNIKKVMEVTLCHIHFPDSNRHNATGDKSNQVSIAGPVEGVEEARRRIRDLQPLVLTFDLPAGLVTGALPDAGSPVIQHVAQAFGVSISFRAQPKLYCSSCVVRGLHGNSTAVKKATCVLMELLLGPDAAVGGATAAGALVSTQLDVTSQQHLFLLGQNGANFLSVMHQTQTQIVLPDLSAPQSSPSLLIQGTADGVCLARQQLMDCLPVCLMFDMREEGESDPRKLAQMMQSLGVFISVKPKVKQTAKSVVVKGLERNIASVYEARRLLLGLDGSDGCGTTGTKPPPTCDPLMTGNGLASYWLNMLMQQLRLNDTGVICPPDAGISSLLSTKPRPSPPPGLTSPNEEGWVAPLRGNDSKLEKIPENEDQPVSTEGQEAGHQQSSLEAMEVMEMPVKNTTVPVKTNVPVKTTLPLKTTVLPMRRGSLSELSVKTKPSARRASLSDLCRDTIQEGGEAITTTFSSSRLLKADMELVNRRYDRRCSLRFVPSLETCSDANKDEDEYHDYERKKQLANQAMQKKPVVTEVRTPTDSWSGLGFSKSMPAEAIKELRSVGRRCYRSYLDNQLGNQQTSWTQASMKDRMCNGSDSENWRDRRGSASALPSSSSASSSPSSSSPPYSSSATSCSMFGSSASRGHTDKCAEGSLTCMNPFEVMSSAGRQGAGGASGLFPEPDDDLPELLSQLGLGKYIDTFQEQEIDFQTFLTLSDEDLKEVGVLTFGARRKMLLAITDLNKRKSKGPDTGYLEGGASGRLPRIVDVDIAAQSNHW